MATPKDIEEDVSKVFSRLSLLFNNVLGRNVSFETTSAAAGNDHLTVVVSRAFSLYAAGASISDLRKYVCGQLKEIKDGDSKTG